MTRSIFTGAGLLVLMHTATAQVYGPAATIDGTEIPRAKVEAQVTHLVNSRGLASGGITQPATYRRIQEEVVELLIVEELLWQEAQRRDFIVSDAEVDAELAGLKARFEDELTFQFRIKEGGFTEDTFREHIRRQLSVQQMIANELIPSIRIDSAAIEAFYSENAERMQVDEQIRARQILIALPADADAETRARALERMQSFREQLEQGASFALLAVEHSEGPSAAQGGDLGFFGRGVMVPAFEQAAFALDPGQISDVVQTEFGLHLIKVEERIDAGRVSLGEVAPQIEDYLGQQALEVSIESLVARLRAEHDVQIHLW